ncbi:hypothetical protein PF002_g4654 [Phytophthora fragariae]|uniref:Uncharacterized protein n=1 Tax=Phytophthora fragariae TaxID=53985 RepID=A0A6A4A8R1_9STRA|nr:hypothetical protein PF003_g7260 [Phytophthora fragariae]KAE9250671.1 hypothetical protein PF002_g4654 [Phytophthora fragariae]
MPVRFGLIIDDWTHGTKHHLAAYGYYVTDSTAAVAVARDERSRRPSECRRA